jgi:PAS domain S-box-containing protein
MSRAHGAAAEAAAQVLETLADACVCIDPDWRITYLNGAAERLWARERVDLLGQDILQVFPQLAGSAKHRLLADALKTGERRQFEAVSLVTGTPIELDVNPGAGGLAIFMRDVRDRWRLKQELAERDVLLRMAEESAGIGIWDIDVATDTVQGTEQFFRIMGLEPTNEPVSMRVLRGLRLDEDRERVNDGYREAVKSHRETYDSEYRIRRPDGAIRLIFGRGRVIRDGGDTPVRYSGIDIDITERKAAQEQRELLLAELQHRIMNTLGLVSAMVTQTLRDAAPAEAAVLTARIAALGRAYQSVAAGDWRSAELSSVVEKAVMPHRSGDGTFCITGPSVQIADRRALALSLALNELATNASKYGALSVPGGRVRIYWRIVQNRDEARLHFRWSESGGPLVRAPLRASFGSRLIQEYLAAAFAGRVRLKFPTKGLICTMSAPLSEAQ